MDDKKELNEEELEQVAGGKPELYSNGARAGAGMKSNKPKSSAEANQQPNFGHALSVAWDE